MVGAAWFALFLASSFSAWRLTGSLSLAPLGLLRTKESWGAGRARRASKQFGPFSSPSIVQQRTKPFQRLELSQMENLVASRVRRVLATKPASCDGYVFTARIAVRISICGSFRLAVFAAASFKSSSSWTSSWTTTAVMRSRASLTVGAPKTSRAARQTLRASVARFMGTSYLAASKSWRDTRTWAASSGPSFSSSSLSSLRRRRRWGGLLRPAVAARRKARPRSSSSRRVRSSGSKASKSLVVASQRAGLTSLTARPSSRSRTAS
mmetsp:Transcript_37682/g.120901  ORF Transcript_37682/g.120901 Transcript_37682/m.120901 type:complete len:266 (-) Transcript_37682:480-1277(-)